MNRITDEDAESPTFKDAHHFEKRQGMCGLDGSEYTYDADGNMVGDLSAALSAYVELVCLGLSFTTPGRGVTNRSLRRGSVVLPGYWGAL